MLVLSRQVDETLVIDTGEGLVEVTVVDIRGDKVRLGITAPNSMRVDRREVHDRIKRETLEAAKRCQLKGGV